jgi:Cdc6-like AAA superfamily ATPase
MIQPEGLTKLRLAINENLRVQRGGADPVPYIDVSNVLNDIGSRQNHAVFARRGCGKTLLLHHSSRQLDSSIKAVYLNCEDFKRHTFPNVLIEILDALFGELERHLTGWFGKKKRSRNLIGDIRKELDQLRTKTDTQEQDVRESLCRDNSASANVGASVSSTPASLRAGAGTTERIKAEIELTYRTLDDKIRELNMKLPRLKAQIREFFELSTAVKGVYLQIDDFYHLNRADQPLVMDYIHRLCKDLPL